jgi:predicted  nucleic acid-binding Zn-ribbon protein
MNQLTTERQMRTVKTPFQIELLLKLHELEMHGETMQRDQELENVERRLDPALLRRYLKLKKKKGTGVAVLKNGICSGCNMVYPETHEIMRYRNCVHNCEFCGRLLVVNGKAA